MTNSILTVTTAATERDLCTLAAVKMELGITATTFDAELAARITQASAAIEVYCRRTFARETVQELFRPAMQMQMVILSRHPITAITSVVSDGATLSAITEFEFDASAGIIYRLTEDQRVAWLERKITVIYQAGYVLPDAGAGVTLPADIQRACILTVASAQMSRGRDPMIRSEAAQGIGQVSYLDPRADALGMTPQVAAMLQPYVAPII